MMSVVSPLALPVLSKVKDDQVRFSRLLARLLSISTVCGVAVGAGFVVLGPAVIRLLYRSDYWSATVFIGVLGVAAAFRTLRIVPNAAQMARADNMALFYANTFRVGGTVLSLVAALTQSPLAVIAWCMLGGELLALAATAWLLRERQGVSLKPMATAAAVMTLMLLLAWASTRLPIWDHSTLLDFAFGGGISALLVLAVVLLYPSLRSEAFASWLKVQRLAAVRLR